MAKKKDFSVGGSAPEPIAKKEHGIVFRKTKVAIPVANGSVQTINFSNHCGHGYDDTIYALVHVIERMVKAKRPAPATVHSGITTGLRNFLRFADERASNGMAPALVSIDAELLDDYAGWLTTRTTPSGERWSANMMRTTYSKTMTFIRSLIAHRLVKRFPLPRNQFPSATAIHNRRRYIRPLSDGEWERVVAALAPEIQKAYASDSDSRLEDTLCLFAFGCYLKTGVNMTPFLEMPRNLDECFREHPRANRRILTLFKARKSGDVVTPLIESKLVSLDVYKLCERARDLTRELLDAHRGSKLANHIWVYLNSNGDIRRLDASRLRVFASELATRHSLVRDDGTPLILSTQMLRNTKLNRVFRRSNDLLAVSKSASNGVRAAQGYLSQTTGQLKELKLAGKVFSERLTGKKGENTPHSGCKDPVNGEFARGDGAPCVDFLSCFRCKSQVITRDDLHRLFSFYWALRGQRERLGRTKWKETFAWIVRVIERDIVPKFPKKLAEREMARARNDPHPMWKSPTVLAAMRSIA